MPFKSEKQRKWMHTNEPEMAKRWEKEEKKESTWPDEKELQDEGKLIEASAYKTASRNELAMYISQLSNTIKGTKDGKMLNLLKKTKKEVEKELKSRKTNEGKLEEKAKRDYKAEYKKFQSSPKSKKYRAELNKYNRKKGTYGNGDGKDASHKGGKISGFEKESVNRGRREKSRLKKEQKLREVIRKIIREDFAGAYPEHQRKKFDNTRRKQSEVLGYKLTGVDDVRTEIDDATVKEVFKRLGQKLNEHMAGGLTYKKGKTITVTHKTSGKELVIIDKPNVRKEYEKIGYVAEGNITEKKESAIDVAKRVVQNKQHEKGLDLTTANFIMQVYKAYDKNPSLQRKLEKLPLKKMISIVYKLIK